MILQMQRFWKKGPNVGLKDHPLETWKLLLEFISGQFTATEKENFLNNQCWLKIWVQWNDWAIILRHSGRDKVSFLFRFRQCSVKCSVFSFAMDFCFVASCLWLFNWKLIELSASILSLIYEIISHQIGFLLTQHDAKSSAKKDCSIWTFWSSQGWRSPLLQLRPRHPRSRCCWVQGAGSFVRDHSRKW